MRRFICKSLLFIIPFVVLHLFTFFFYATDRGDLLRLGYIIDIYPSYREIFQNEYRKKTNYFKLSDQLQSRHYKVLTIGDSYSELGNVGYQNYLDTTIDLLHYDRRLHPNANTIETLFSLLDGDFFDHYKFEFVILQSSERAFVERVINLDTTKVITLKEITKKIKSPAVTETREFNFFSEKIIKFPYYTFQYFAKDDFYFPQVYRAITKGKRFSVDRNELLFFYMDIHYLKINNNESQVSNLNKSLNDLARKLKFRDIKLIVLPSPDKYDMYYESIVNKENYVKPIFFEYMRVMNKDYIYIDSKQIIESYLDVKKDLYLYDDTHWSPWTAMIIGRELTKRIQE